MTTEAITPLRQRMIEDMNSRKLDRRKQWSWSYGNTPQLNLVNSRSRLLADGLPWALTTVANALNAGARGIRETSHINR